MAASNRCVRARRFPDRERAVAHVRRCLDDGGELCAAIASRHDFGSGSFLTWLPEATSDQDALRLDEGGRLPADGVGAHPDYPGRVEAVANTDRELATCVEAYLAEEPSGVVLFEDATAGPADPFLAILDVRTLVSNTSVYYLLCSGDDADLVRRTIRRAQGWLFVGAFAAAPVNMRDRLLSDRKVELDTIRVVAENLTALAIGVYDRESYLLWMADNP